MRKIVLFLVFLLINLKSSTVSGDTINNINVSPNKKIRFSNSLFFEDIYLLGKCKSFINGYKRKISSNDVRSIYTELDNCRSEINSTSNESAKCKKNDDIISTFNKKIKFNLYDIPNYQKNNKIIYEKITNDFTKTKLGGSKYKIAYDIFSDFTTKIGKNIITNVYNRYNEIDIYDTDKYLFEYYYLLNYFDENSSKKKENLKDIEEWALSQIKDECVFDKDLNSDETMVIALLIRQIKTVNKLLYGINLSPLDIYFNELFCESNITLLYNVDLFAKSISKILENENVYKKDGDSYSISDIKEIFNNNILISDNDVIAYLQFNIKYYTNNNDNKYIGLYNIFEAVNSYIYYNYNYKEKSNKYKFKDKKEKYAKEVFKYLMDMDDKTFKRTTTDYNGLENINLSELDYMIKRNIHNIYDNISKYKEKSKMFFSGLFQIMEFFSVKNNVYYRNANLVNNVKLTEYNEDPKSLTKEIEDLRKLKILADTVNSIIYQIKLKYNNERLTVYNPKNPDKESYLNFYMIIKQNEIVENTSNILEDVFELKKLFKRTDKNDYSTISDDLYYQNLNTFNVSNESIAGINGSLMENFIHLLKKTLDAIDIEEFYDVRCMAILNTSNDSIEINKNYKDFLFLKYPILQKTFYDISNYYYDLNFNDCEKYLYEIAMFTDEFSQYIKNSVIFCNTNGNKSHKNRLDYLVYDDIKIKLSTLLNEDKKENELTELSNIKTMIEKKYKENQGFYPIYDLNKVYEEILYYNQYIKDNIDYSDYTQYKIKIDYHDFNDFTSDASRIKYINNDSNLNTKRDNESIVDIMDKIIDDSSNILFDNFIDKNVCLFSCDKKEYEDIKKKYEIRKNKILNGKYIIENLFNKYLIENAVMYQKIYSVCNEDELMQKSNIDISVIDLDVYGYTSERNIDLNEIPYYFINYGIDEYIYSLQNNKETYTAFLNVVSNNEKLSSQFYDIFYNESLNNSTELTANGAINNIRKVIFIQDVLYNYLNNIIDGNSNFNTLRKRQETTLDDKSNENGLTERILSVLNKMNNSFEQMAQNAGKIERQIYNYVEDDSYSPFKKAVYDYALKCDDLSTLIVKWRLYKKLKKEKNKTKTSNDSDQTKDNKSSDVPTKGDQPKDNDSSDVPTKGDQPKDNESNDVQTKGDQPKDNESSDVPTKGEQPKDNESNDVPTKGEQPKDNESNDVPTKGDQPKDNESSDVPTKGDQPKDNESNDVPTKGDQPKDNESSDASTKGDNNSKTDKRNDKKLKSTANTSKNVNKNKEKINKNINNKNNGNSQNSKSRMKKIKKKFFGIKPKINNNSKKSK